MSHRRQEDARYGRRILLALLLGAAALVLAGIALASASPSPSLNGAGDRTTLRIGWVQDVDNLNPFIGMQGTDYMLWHLNYDFLVGFDAQTLEPRPELATAWEVSPDGKEWTFTIRSGSTFHDGVPVTARDVAFTFNYIVDDELLNLATYTNGIVKAEAVDETTVKIYTDAPKANMLRMVVPILPEHVWSKVSGKAATSTDQNKPPIVGNGPFQIVEWQKGKCVRLEANPDYWGGAPKVDEVIFQLYTNPDTMAQDLRLGTIDGALDVPPAQFKQFGSEPGLEANNATSWRFIELGMNCYESPDSLGNPVLLDPELRKAVNWAVDRQKVADVAYQGYATVGSTIIVPSIQVPLGAARGQPVLLRRGQSQRASRRGRLQGRQRRRLPRDQGRQEAQPALLRHLGSAREPDRRQAHRRLAQGCRPQVAVPGAGRRCPLRRPVQLQG